MILRILDTFAQFLAESLPLFLLGVGLGALLETWLKQSWLKRWLDRGRYSVITATIIGALLPGCAVSTVPLAQTLQKRGVPPGTITAFIMIAPILSPHTIVLTATLISVPMAIGRVVLSFLVSIVLGQLLNTFLWKEATAMAGAQPNLSRVAASIDDEEDGCCEPSPVIPGSVCDADGGLPNKSIPRRFLHRFWSNFRSLAPYLIVGLLVAAFLSVMIPTEVMHKYLRGGWTAYLFAILVGIPVYVCDGGEIPLTRALLEMGVGPGPAFCFMLASVGTCLPTIAMATRIIGWSVTFIYIAAWLVLALGGGVLMAALLR